MKIVKDYNETEIAEVIEITSANYVKENTIEIFFSDGAVRIIDFKPFLTTALHPSISKYLNPTLFTQFKIVNGNLNWNDYDLIFPIDNLYEGQLN